MKLIEVKTQKDKRKFHDVSRIINRDDLNWVCPPDRLIEDIFNSKKNVFAREGDFVRWILISSDGTLIGRVAAFINSDKVNVYDVPTAGMGYFECINNDEAAFMLFDVCSEWLRKRGIQAMLGPINLGENDKFWGLLVEGFTMPTFGMSYNQPYYKSLFEKYGFEVFFEQQTNLLSLENKFSERFYKVAEWLLSKPGYNFIHFSYKERKRLVQDFVEIYNDAWLDHANFSPVNEKDVEKQLRDLKPFMIEDFIWFAYYENEPIALFCMIPDINPILKRFNGRFNLWNQLRFLFYIRRRHLNRTRIVVMGVKRKYQNRGLEAGFFWHIEKAMSKYPEYKEIELSWVGDFNTKMISLHQTLGAVPSKKHITFIKKLS